MIPFKLLDVVTVKTNFLRKHQTLNDREREQLVQILTAMMEEDEKMIQRKVLFSSQKVKDLCVDTSDDLPDDLNPVYIFSLTSTQLLVQIVNDEIDAKKLALDQLYNR